MKLFASLRAPVLITIVLSILAIAATAQPKAKPTPKPKPSTSTATTAGPNSARCSDTNGLTGIEITELLDAQNRERTTQKLPLFSWDCTLAKAAQEWANKGVFAHREDTNYGENMFVSSHAQENVLSSVSRWMSEQHNWTNSTGTCAAGKICNHYTQVMWKTTRKVGCGINRNGAVKWKVVLVCNYDPAGNNPGPAY